MWSPVDWARIRRASIHGILHARKGTSQKLPRSIRVIPTTREIVLIGVKPAPESACSGGGAGRNKYAYFRILKIGLCKKSKVFVRSHPQIVRSAKGGHLAFHTKKN